MLSNFYQNTVLKNPKSIFLLLIITLLSFGYLVEVSKQAYSQTTQTLLIGMKDKWMIIKSQNIRHGWS